MNLHQLDVVLEIATSARRVLQELGRAPFQRSLNPLAPSRLNTSQRAVEGARAVSAYASQGRGVVNAARNTEHPKEGVFSRAMGAVTRLEQRLSSAVQRGVDGVPVLGAVVSLRAPALNTDSLVLGMPHAHNHPPNLIPPNPVPIPLPSIGRFYQVPMLGCASKVTVRGAPAVRCGDMSFALMCGGFFPFFEMFFGSSKVWIEGQRAARGGVDMTSHCIFTVPKPTDPPLGPTVGFAVPTQIKVAIGGMPMPSLTSLGMGLAMRGVFAVLGGAARWILRIPRVNALVSRATRPIHDALRRRAAALVDRVLDSGRLVIGGADDAFRAAVRDDLVALALTRDGRRLLRQIRAGQHTHTISPLSDAINTATRAGHRPPGGPFMHSLTPHGQMHVVPPNTPGSFRARRVGRQGPDGEFVPIPRNEQVTEHLLPGAGSGSHIHYDPTRATQVHRITPTTPSHAILGHEMQHSVNVGNGRQASFHGGDTPRWLDHNDRFQSFEEMSAVTSENGLRDDLGLPLRHSY